MRVKIYRYFQNGKPSKLIKTVSSVEEAKRHCNDPKTSKAGQWFDGYTID